MNGEIRHWQVADEIYSLRHILSYVKVAPAAKYKRRKK